MQDMLEDSHLKRIIKNTEFWPDKTYFIQKKYTSNKYFSYYWISVEAEYSSFQKIWNVAPWIHSMYSCGRNVVYSLGTSIFNDKYFEYVVDNY